VQRAEPARRLARADAQLERRERIHATGRIGHGVLEVVETRDLDPDLAQVEVRVPLQLGHEPTLDDADVRPVRVIVSLVRGPTMNLCVT
jgi:hypothetical protein